jgi:hypothetical protein
LPQATGTDPCILHANGWDKGPLLSLLQEAGRLSEQQQHDLLELKAALEKKKTLQVREKNINDRCAHHNPNAHLDPERNLIAEYGLLEKQEVLRQRLEQRGANWDVIEKQIFEVQEYLGFCPAPPPVAVRPASDPRYNAAANAQAYRLRNCTNGFKVFIYPRSDDLVAGTYKVWLGSWTFGGSSYVGQQIYNAVIDALQDSPYITTDPDEACVLIPSVDVSCWLVLFV